MLGAVQELIQAEVGNMLRLGEQPPTPAEIRDRVQALMAAAKRAAIKKAPTGELSVAFASSTTSWSRAGSTRRWPRCWSTCRCSRSAASRGRWSASRPTVTWVNGKAQVVDKPKMFWNRVSPFDVWWTPGVSNIADAAVIERTRVTRSDLNQLIGLPGYNEDAIREVLQMVRQVWLCRGQRLDGRYRRAR